MNHNAPTCPPAQLVTVEATDGLQLPALFFCPRRPTKRLAIWLHGMGTGGSFYNTVRTNALARALTDSGTALLALNNRGAHLLQGLKFLDESGALQRRTVGTTHELIAECVPDIDGAVGFARDADFDELYLLGHSTGANKICVYNHLKPDNAFAGYALVSGGDDTGLMYEDLGPERFNEALKVARERVKAGHGSDLAPLELIGEVFSYQSVLDMLDPDGGYNTFPFYEVQSGVQLSTEPLFRYYRGIAKPALVVYGASDEYCRPDAATCLQILRDQHPAGHLDFELIPEADHGFAGKEAELAAAIAGWVSQTRKA